LTVAGAPADRIDVPGDFASIQSAIDAAEDGDLVLIQPGTYLERIDFRGKAIVVSGSDPRDSVLVAGTVIDASACAGGSCSVVSFVSGEGPRSVLAGVTVTGGSGTVDRSAPLTTTGGGGICCVRSAPTIRDCHVRENRPLGFKVKGGGLCCDRAAVTLTRCRIVDNLCDESKDTSRDRGGGIFARDSELTIEASTISANSAEDGGGMWLVGSSARILGTRVVRNIAIKGDAYAGGIGLDRSTVMLRRCTISGNRTKGPLSIGGAIYSEGSSLSVLHCEIADNTIGGVRTYWGSVEIRNSAFLRNVCIGTWVGGGLTIEGPDRALVSRCLFYGNRAEDGGGVHLGETYREGRVENCRIVCNTATGNGGGIYIDGDQWDITNCVVSRNTGRHGSGIYTVLYDAIITNTTIVANESPMGGGFHAHRFSVPTLTNCIIRDNVPTQVAHTEDSPTITYSNVQDGWPGTGNIDADPLFLTIEHDAYLPHPKHSPCIDAGDPLILDGVYDRHPLWPERFPNSSRSDMGAYGGPGNTGWLPLWGLPFR